MKIGTTFPIESVDLTPLTKLVFPLWGQWDSLRFAADGTLLNGMTGDEIPHFHLVDGQHRKAGSTYAVIVSEMDPDRADDPPRAYALFARLEKDDRHNLGMSVLPEKDHPSRYSGSGQLEKRAWPKGEGKATITHSHLPSNLLVRFSVGTEIEIEGRFDTAVLQPGEGGQLAHGTWCAGRFGGIGSIDVQQTSDDWRDVTVDVSLTGRGIFRPLVFIFSPVLRRLAKSVLNDMQADFTGEFPNLHLDLADIAAATTTDNDARLFVHRLLWEEGFSDAAFLPRSAVSEEVQAALTQRFQDIANER